MPQPREVHIHHHYTPELSYSSRSSTDYRSSRRRHRSAGPCSYSARYFSDNRGGHSGAYFRDNSRHATFAYPEVTSTRRYPMSARCYSERRSHSHNPGGAVYYSDNKTPCTATMYYNVK